MSNVSFAAVAVSFTHTIKGMNDITNVILLNCLSLLMIDHLNCADISQYCLTSCTLSLFQFVNEPCSSSI